MGRRWKVYRDAEYFGEMSSADIRNGLREGDLDPFDQVAELDSDIRQELSEVDEIFLPEGAGGSNHLAEVGESEPGPLVFEPGRKSGTQISDPAALKKKSGSQSRVFYLKDRYGRTLGPITAKEIEVLYADGKLSPRVQVQRKGAPKRLPIKNFMAVYGKRSKPAKLRIPQDHNEINVQNLHRLRLNAQQFSSNQLVPITLMVLVGALFGVLVFRYSQKSKKSVREYRHKIEQTRKFKNKERKRIPARKVKRTKWVTSPKGKVVKALKTSPRKKPTRRTSKPLAKSRRSQVLRRTPPKPSKRPAAVSGAYNPPVQVFRSSDPAKTRVTRPPPQTRPKSPPVAQRVTGNNYLASYVGKTVTSGPARYSKAQLSACGLKCKLFFRDSRGATFTGIFFKGAYEGILSRGVPVKVTGTVKKAAGGYVIYVEDLKP